MIQPSNQIQLNGLPLAPIERRTTNANYLAKVGHSTKPAPASKIGVLLQSKVHRGRG